MKIITPYAKMIAPAAHSGFSRTYDPQLGYAEFKVEDGIDLLKHVEWSARISHRSEDSVTHDSFDRLLRAVVLQHGDWSVVEHCAVSVDMYVDRGITHELVRHRLFGFTQESTRFVNYEKKMPPAFVYPYPDVKCEHCLAGHQPTRMKWPDGKKTFEHQHIEGVAPACAYDPEWLNAIAHVENAYKSLMTSKWRGQEARSVFPNALASRIVITGNLRNWRHFFLMRTSKEAHPQMREVTIPLLAEFKQKIPILYEDIEPNARQIDNMAKAR